MIILIALSVLWASYGLAEHLRGRVEGAVRRKPGSGISDSPISTPTCSCEDLTWGTLDDHQLTRLLRQAGSRSTAEVNDHADINQNFKEQW